MFQGDGAEKEDVAATEKEDEEEPSNLQLAWEMLELAKNILMKQSESLKDTDKDKKSLVDSRICDTYQTLGEVSIENENYQQVNKIFFFRINILASKDSEAIFDFKRT